jgi:hypothetical protein
MSGANTSFFQSRLPTGCLYISADLVTLWSWLLRCSDDGARRLKSRPGAEETCWEVVRIGLLARQHATRKEGGMASQVSKNRHQALVVV